MPLPAVLPYPDIDPILFELGPFAIRWYALAYIAGLMLGWRYVLRLNRGPARIMEDRQIDDLLVWMTLGVVFGGRLGYVLFYNLPYYAGRPLEIFAVWQGGMAFHGAILGVVAALLLFAWRNRLAPLRLGDLVAPAVPIGLFFGRIANFINGELYGRPSDVAWAVVFPGGGPEPRHPSQLYEALLEGALLFIVLCWLARRPASFARPGLLTGVFLVGYALGRGLVELFRQPDAQLGFLVAGSTMGQWLSLPMLIAGLVLIGLACRRPAASP